MKRIFLSVCIAGIWLTLITFNLQAQEKLRMDIVNLTRTIEAETGVGIKHLDRGDTLTVHGQGHFPMQSVYKFHLALAVLSQVDQGKLSVEQKIMIRKENFIPHTHSPIADKYPEGNVELTIKELLSYTVAQSDNNGCDILFGLVGGPKKVESFIHDLGVKDVSIANTEEEMHKGWGVQFKNWTTPYAMTQLLHLFYDKKILLPASHDLLMAIMQKTSTGPKRIKGLLPAGTVVAHKTGMGGNDEIITAINDVGIVTLPNGDHIAIAFFISNTKESVGKLEGVMAKISKLVFDYYINYK